MRGLSRTLGALFAASVLTAPAWANSLIARWDNFTGLTAENSLFPSQSATVNGLNGGSWRFNLGGGSVTDGVLATGIGSAPNIEFDEAFDVGRTSKPITVLVAVKLPYTPVANKPILHIGNGSVGYGLVSMTSNKVASSWQNTAWSSSTKQATFDGLAGKDGVVYLVYSVADTSTNASVTSVTLDTATYTWQTFSGLTGTGVSSSKIVFGNFVNVTEGGLNYNLKSVAVFNGAFAPLEDVQDVIRAWEGIMVTDVATAISDATSWSTASWVPSKPVNDASNVTLTVSGKRTLTMNESASVIRLTVDDAADGENALIIAKTDSNKLTANTTTINADTTVNAGAASLGTVTIAADKTLTVKENWANVAKNVPTAATNLGKIRFEGGSAETPIVFSMGSTNNANPGALVMAPGSVVKLTATGGNKVYNITGESDGVKPEVRLHCTQNKGWGVTQAGSHFSNVKVVLPANNNNEGTGNTSFWWTSGTIASDGSVDFEVLSTQTITFENTTTPIYFGSLKMLGTISGNSLALTVNVKDGELRGTGTWSNNVPIVVDNSGEGTFTVARTYGAALTINGNGSVTVAEGGSLTGSVTVTGKLTYAANATPTNTITNNGTIAADGAGTEVNLTGATLSGSGTYAVKNKATLLVTLAQTVGKTIAVETGATLKVKLSALEVLSAQSVMVEGAGTVQFVDAGGNVLDEGRTYTPDIPEYTYTVGANEPWGGETPVANAKITINFGETENQVVDLTTVLGEITSVAQLIVTGTNGGSITKTGNGALTIGEFRPETDVTVTGAFLKDCVTARATITVPEAKTLSIFVPDGGSEWDCALKQSFDGAGVVRKIGAGSLSLEDAYTAFTCPNMVVDEGAFRMASGGAFANYANAYAITVNNGAKFMLGYYAALTGNTTITLNDGATMECKNGNHSTVSTAAIVVKGNATIRGSLYGLTTEFGGSVSGNGTLTLEKISTGNDPLKFSGVIADGAEGTLKVVVNHPGGVTFTSNGNTYTGGTEIAAGAKLTIANAAALGTEGAITGAGELICDGVLPTNMNGLTDATNWRGTVKVQDFTGGTNAGAAELNLDAYGNANSVVELANVAGWVADGTVVENLKLSGSFSQNNGSTSAAAKVTIKKLSGAGNFNGPSGSNWQYGFIVNDCEEFSGSINLKSGGKGGFIGLVIGSPIASYDHDTYKTHITVLADGVATIAENATWTPATGSGGKTIVYGTLSGTGTIDSALTLADGATLNVENGAVTVNGAVTLPSALTVKIAESQDVVGTAVPLLNAANVPNLGGQTVKVMVGETVGKKLYTMTHEDGAVKLTIAERPVTNTVTATVSAGGTLTLSAALGDYALAANATLTINFGDKPQDGNAVPSTFTFDNAGAVSFAKIIVTGTNGGTIAKTGETVTTALLTVNTSATLANGAVAATDTVTIAENCVLTYEVGDNMTVNATHTGSGSIVVTSAGVVDGGKLEITKTCEVNVEVNESASLVVNVDPAFDGNTFTKALKDNVTVSGDGSVFLQQGIAYANFTVSYVEVKGTYYLGIGGTTQNPVGAFTPTSLTVGEGAALKVRAYRGYSLTVNTVHVEGEGSIAQDGGDTTPTMTVNANATLSGAGKIEIPLTFADGATLDASAGPLTAGTVTIADGVTVTVIPPAKPTAGAEILKCTNASAIVRKLTATPMPTGLKFAANADNTAVVLAAVPAIVIPPVAEGEGSVALSSESQATLLAVAQNQGLTEVRAVTGSTTVEGSETRLTAAQIDSALAVFGDSIVKADGTTLKVDYNFGIVAVEPYYYNGTLMSFIVKVKAETGTGDAATLTSGVTINLVDGESGAVIHDLYGRGFDGPDSNGIYAASFTSDDTVADRLIGRSFKVKATKK